MESPTPPPSDAEGLRVLVVDDNAGDRWYFSELLRSRDYAVLACEDAETAWEVYQATPTPLALVDLYLPGMDGTELCRRIKDHPDGHGTLILGITGSSDPGAIGRMLDAGADDFLTKPVDPDLLDVRLHIAEDRLQVERRERDVRRRLDERTRDLRRLFENLPDVFFSVDLQERRLVQVSSSSRSMLGHEPDELLENAELWPPALLGGDDDGALWDALAASTPGRPEVRDHQHRDGDGRVRHLRTRLWVDADGSGEAVRLDGVVRDVTPLEQANRKLARRNRELASLNRLSAVSLTDSSSREALEEMLAEVCSVLGASAAAVEIEDPEGGRARVPLATFGLDGTEPTRDGRPSHATLVGRSIDAEKPVLETDPRALADEGPDYARPEEHGFLLSLPLRTGDGTLGALILLGPADEAPSQGDQVLAEHLAHSVASHVERMETERTRRHNRGQYDAVVAKLSDANTELEAFAYSIAHDIRAPLRTMQGFAHALLRNYGEELSEDAQDYVRRIIASGKQSEELLADLLKYSRVSFQEMVLQPVALSGVVETALEQLQADIRTSGARIEVKEPLLTIPGSRPLLMQVVTNLVSNAIKFVPKDRTPDIVLRAEERGSRARLWVEDNGIGIPQDRVEKIFQVFEQLHQDEPRPGTGIGLAIVRRAVQRMGGTVGVQPRKGGGSAFWIEVPEASDGRRRMRRG